MEERLLLLLIHKAIPLLRILRINMSQNMCCSKQTCLKKTEFRTIMFKKRISRNYFQISKWFSFITRKNIGKQNIIILTITS